MIVFNDSRAIGDFSNQATECLRAELLRVLVKSDCCATLSRMRVEKHFSNPRTLKLSAAANGFVL
jgi:hypothetical protein